MSFRSVHLLLSIIHLASAASTCEVPADSTRSFDVRMNNLKLPNISTYYACQQFKIPSDEEYHATVFEPLIENKDLIHHMLLFGCGSQLRVHGAHECGVVDGVCTSWLAQYTIGLDGKICAHNNTGIRFGRHSYSNFLLQIHYNNERLQSGIKGISGKMEVYRAGKLKTAVAHDIKYTYDQSPIHTMDKPIAILPGDEIRVTCTYKNPTNKTYYFGEGSKAEMCYAFVSYYPKVDRFDQCIQISDYDVNCPNMQGSIFIEYPWDQTKYTMTSMRALQEVTASCFSSDCVPQCVTKTKEIKANLRPKPRALLNTYARSLLKKTTDIFVEQGFYKNMKCAYLDK